MEGREANKNHKETNWAWPLFFYFFIYCNSYIWMLCAVGRKYVYGFDHHLTPKTGIREEEEKA